MHETKRLLEHARDGFAPPSDVMADLIRRRAQKQQRERIATGAVALAIVVMAAMLLRSFTVAPPTPIAPPTPTTGGLVSSIDQGQILFVVFRTKGDDPKRSVVSVIDGGSLQKVAGRPGARMFHVTWASPTDIVYDGRKDGARHLFRMSLTTGEVAQLTEGPAAQIKAAISPDGRQMAYDNYDPETGRDLGMQIANVDGSDPRQLLPGSPIGSRAGNSDAEFSPNAEWIAFTRLADSLTGESAIFVVRTDGTGLRRLTDDALRGSRPRWSPDGNTILFQQIDDGIGPGGLWTVPFEGGEPELLTDHGTQEAAFEADWSPDGTQIVFKYWNPSMAHNELRIVDADGSNERILWVGRDGVDAETPEWGTPPGG